MILLRMQYLAWLTVLAAPAAGCAFEPECGTRAECLDVDFTTDADGTFERDAGPASDLSIDDTGPGGPTDTNGSGEQCPAPDTCGGWEPNNRPDNAARLVDEPVGCLWDDFEPWQRTIGSSMCAEDRDYFRLEVASCRSRSFLLDARLSVSDRCVDRPSFDFESSLYGCGHERVNCESLGDGTLQILALIPSSDQQTVHEFVFEITGAEEVGFDYVLSVELRL